MSLTVGHVLGIALMTALGAARGRVIASRSPRLWYVNEGAWAALLLVGATLPGCWWRQWLGTGADGRSLYRRGVWDGGFRAAPGEPGAGERRAACARRARKHVQPRGHGREQTG